MPANEPKIASQTSQEFFCPNTNGPSKATNTALVAVRKALSPGPMRVMAVNDNINAIEPNTPRHHNEGLLSPNNCPTWLRHNAGISKIARLLTTRTKLIRVGGISVSSSLMANTEAFIHENNKQANNISNRPRRLTAKRRLCVGSLLGVALFTNCWLFECVARSVT